MRRLVPGLATLALLAGASTSAAQGTASSGDFIVPIVATIVPIVRSVQSLDGTSEVVEGQEETTIRLAADVFFAFDSAELSPEASAFLREDVAAGLAGRQLPAIAVDGHTDSRGDDPYNDDLSQRRAEAVAAVLRDALPGTEVTSAGFGEREPVAPNETEEGQDDPAGQQRNRRVEIRFSGGEGAIPAPDVPGELPDPASA